MNLPNTYEVNFDGLVGPTHNYGGLSFGNTASMQHSCLISNPKASAKEGLEKMQTLTFLGIKQAILPPQARPFIPLLRSLGYKGEVAAILKEASKTNPKLLMASYSAASMWTANAATVSPSSDCEDGKVHFTPANLINKLHRTIESPITSLILQKLFPDPKFFSHHPPLIGHADFSDEGAANHTRFCKNYGGPGVQLFVFGRRAFEDNSPQPLIYPARQTKEASEAIARLHGLSSQRIIFAQQNPEVIDAGVFHNDVISVGNQNVFFYHERAFVNTDEVIEQIQEFVQRECQTAMHFIKVTEEQVPLKDAVSTYLFNSQLVTLRTGNMGLIAPMQCYDAPSVHTYLKELLLRSNHPIKQVIYQDIRQSMQNGGGPACLRLRVVLTEKELSHVCPSVLLNNHLYSTLNQWIDRHYRDQLSPSDLLDPQLLQESQQALDELTKILKLGSIYPFQK